MAPVCRLRIAVVPSGIMVSIPSDLSRHWRHF